jgi:hypothetical protein
MLYYGPLLAIAEVEQRTLLSFSRRGRVGTYATTSIYVSVAYLLDGSCLSDGIEGNCKA